MFDLAVPWRLLVNGHRRPAQVPFAGRCFNPVKWRAVVSGKQPIWLYRGGACPAVHYCSPAWSKVLINFATGDSTEAENFSLLCDPEAFEHWNLGKVQEECKGHCSDE